MATTTLAPRAETYRRSWILEWLTTVDHKKIGIMYIVNSFFFFFAAGILALVVRSELAVPGLLILSGYLFGGAAAEGWTGYTPLSSAYAPGVGTDLWLIGLILVGTASILGSVNFIATIFKMRAPGMTLFRMPILVWTVLVTQTLILLATPVL